MCDTAYCHQYYVDGSPQAGDVYADFGSGDQWRTVLVTGLREGGEAYFALDVTSGESFDDIDPDDRIKFLWEFSDDELGETWNDPSIERVTDVTVSADPPPTAWGVFFGSGYSPTNQDTKQAYMYGILAHNKEPLWKTTECTPADDDDDDPICLDVDTNRVKIGGAIVKVLKVKNYPDWDTSKHFAVGEIVQGQSSGTEAKVVEVQWVDGSSTWAWITIKDLTGSFTDWEQIKGKVNTNHQADLIGNVVLQKGSFSNDAMASPLLVDMEADYVADRIYAGNLYGNMYRITDIGKGQKPVVQTLFTFDHADPKPDFNPIRAKADYAYCGDDEGCDVWVYFGTGIYEQQIHKTNNITQYFFGLQDTQAGVATYENIMDPRIVKLQALFKTVTIDSKDVVVRTVSGSNPHNGPWAIELAPGATGSERSLSKPLVVGGIVFFSTFVPDANVCEGSGDTYLFAVDYKSGAAPLEPVFDLNGDGAYNESDKVDGEIPIGIHVGRGKGSHPVLHKRTMFITTTGSGDEDGSDPGGLVPLRINIPNQKVAVETWRQR
jgi:Tfp pilus tip-associated adhesin PilY1